MVEQQQRKIEDEMTKLVQKIDREHLRKIQRNMHKCAAKCCEDSTSSMESVHKCVEDCSSSLIEAQNFIHNEFSGVQNRFQRCILECNDSVKDKMGASPSESDVKRYTNEFEGCAIKCVDKHVELIPLMYKRMAEMLNKKAATNVQYN